MGSTYSRREFLTRSLGIGAGAAALQILSQAGAAAAPPRHPLAHKDEPEVLLRWVPTLYDAVRRERYTPPNAARTYAYFGVAAYEAVVGGMPSHRSLGGQLNDLPALPAPASNRRYDWPAAANAAMARLAPALFAGKAASLAQLADLEAAFHAERAAAVGDATVMDRSVAHGRAVGDAIVAWIARDGWAGIQGRPYTPPVGPGLWRSTPPNFGTAIEPHWRHVRTFALPAATACAPEPPVPYSPDQGSPFYDQAQATYDTVNAITPAQLEIALRWRDNPDGTTGLPSGHWALIVTILIRDLGLDLARAVEVLALHGIAVADGFTSCWTEKYITNLLRPVTYINDHIDPAWKTPVNTPQFPEYTSGHSVGSGAAAATLTTLLGTVPFTDDTGLANGFAARRYESVWEAANEAAISRQYGGIHYPMGITAGVDQGVCVAREVLGRVSTRRGS